MIRLPALLILLFITSVSHSEVPNHGYLGLGLQLSSVTFSEHEGGRLLNEETGQLPLAEIRVGHRWPHSLYLQASLATGASSLTYQGESQLGRPLATESDYAGTRAEALAGRTFNRGALFAGLAFEQYERIIQPHQGITGLQENVHKVEGFVGGEKTLIDFGGSRLYLEGRVYTGIAGELSVDFAGRYDSASVDIGRTVLTQVKLAWVGEWKNGWALHLAPTLAYRRSDRSAATHLYRSGVDTSLSFHQPPTEQRIIGISAVLYRYF